jgi:hypothetical protein
MRIGDAGGRYTNVAIALAAGEGQLHLRKHPASVLPEYRWRLRYCNERGARLPSGGRGEAAVWRFRMDGSPKSAEHPEKTEDPRDAGRQGLASRAAGAAS